MYDISSIVQISPEELDFIHNVNFTLSGYNVSKEIYNHPLVYDFTAIYDKLLGDSVDWDDYEVTENTIKRVHEAITYPDDKDGQKYMKKCKTNDLFMIYVPVAFLYGLAYAITRNFPEIFPPEQVELNSE